MLPPARVPGGTRRTLGPVVQYKVKAEGEVYRYLKDTGLGRVSTLVMRGVVASKCLRNFTTSIAKTHIIFIHSSRYFHADRAKGGAGLSA